MKRSTPSVANRLASHPGAAALVASGLALGGMAIFSKIAAERAEREHPPTGKFVTVDGVRIHYLEAGRGPTVLLLHGNGAMAEDFVISGLFGQLAERYHVIAPDRPGFGYTERPRDRIWTANAQAALFSGFVAECGLSEPIVLGHSWGTLVSVALGLRSDVRLRGLVLLSGYYFASARLDVIALSSPALPVIGDVLRYTLSPLIGRVAAPAAFKKMFKPAPVPARFEAQFPREMALRPWQIRASAEETALMIPSAAALQEHYGDLDLPVAILAGSGDAIIDPTDQSERLHRGIRGSELTLLKGLGHMIHYGAAGRIKHAVDMVARR